VGVRQWDNGTRKGRHLLPKLSTPAISGEAGSTRLGHEAPEPDATG
jgi:hypothetical protein